MRCVCVHVGVRVCVREFVCVYACVFVCVCVWAVLDQRIIDNAVAQRRQRLRAGVQAEGGHFEHLL